jgi:dienelactone hydrolase
MLFLQGTRDEFADLQLLSAVVERLGARATLELFDDADHSFHVPARTGRKDSQIRLEMATAVAEWMSATVEAATGT